MCRKYPVTVCPIARLAEEAPLFTHVGTSRNRSSARYGDTAVGKEAGSNGGGIVRGTPHIGMHHVLSVAARPDAVNVRILWALCSLTLWVFQGGIRTGAAALFAPYLHHPGPQKPGNLELVGATERNPRLGCDPMSMPVRERWGSGPQTMGERSW